MLSRINPQIRLTKEIIIVPVDNIAVGIRGTNPVSRNSVIIG